jgi:NADPH-dependent curcumin reductase CurA
VVRGASKDHDAVVKGWEVYGFDERDGGVENAPQAFMGMLNGENFGEVVLKIKE